MAITISQEPKRSRDGTEVFFVAIDNGMWFEFEATGAGSPLVYESKCRVDLYLTDNTKINTDDIVLFFGVDNKVFFDASPYIQPYLNNDNDNTYQAAVETDANASQGFYLKYGEYPVPSPDDVATSSTYYATKAAKQYGDTYGQNMASYWSSSSQVVLAKLLTKQKTLPVWSGFPFSLSFIDSSYVDTANITQLSNTGVELSNVDYPALTNNTIEQVNILSINASAKKLNVSLGHTPAFTFTVDTTKAGSASDTIELPLLSSGGTYSGIIDWGDGNTSSTSYANRSHTYSTGGIYTIKITGTCTGWSFNNLGDKDKITNISEWGSFENGAAFCFRGCSNLDISATDAPTINGDCSNFFDFCATLGAINMNEWDFSAVTNMSSFFKDCPLVNPINFNNKVFTLCTNFFNMFHDCDAFDSDISVWDVSSATIMSNMFSKCAIFNQNIGGWDVSNVTNFQSMLDTCPLFNQDISAWNVTKGTNFANMFIVATSFNQDISTWTINSTSSVSMLNMFYGATAFKQDLSAWNFRKVTNFSNMFLGVDINNPYSKTLGSPSGDNSNYDALIIKLESDAAAVDPAQDNLSFHGGNSEYTAGGAVQTAHDNLTAATPGGNGWTITDGGAT